MVASLEEAKGRAGRPNEKDERIKELEEQVRDLMFALEAGQLVGQSAAGGGDESIQGGSILGVGESERERQKRILREKTRRK